MTDEGAAGPAARLLQSVTRFGATLLGVVETRIDLLSTEIGEDSARGFRILFWTAVALFAGFAGLIFTGIAIIAVLWDTHRVGATLSVAGIFLAITALAALLSRRLLLAKPRFLDATRTELTRDVDALRSRQ